MRHVQIIVCFLLWGMGKSYDCRECIFCSIACFLLFFAVKIMTESLFLSGQSRSLDCLGGLFVPKGHFQIHSNKGIFLYLINIDWHLQGFPEL